MLSPRAGIILKSIAGQYIVKGMPVSSQSITTDYELGVSPAPFPPDERGDLSNVARLRAVRCQLAFLHSSDSPYLRVCFRLKGGGE